MYRLLLLEDDISLIDGLDYALKKNGFQVEIVRTVGEARLRMAELNQFDAVILDVTLPDGTGFDVCGMIRSSGCRVPVIFLTASDEEVNVIRGLDCGGDDYITKPFKLGELCARIRALMRRAGMLDRENNALFVCGGIVIDPMGCRMTQNGRTLELTGLEYRLLNLLVRNVNCVVTRDRILTELWDDTGNFVDGNTLSVYIRRIREKVEVDPSHPQYLLTVRGFGYQWKEVSL